MSQALNNQDLPAEGTKDSYFGIEFASIEPVMQIYCQALTGKDVDITTSKGPTTMLRNTWWDQFKSGNSPDGTINVVVPATFMDYPSYTDNFGWYKAALTQQVGHIEFGSFDFDFDRDSNLFENLRSGMRPGDGSRGSSLGRYLSLFDDRLLAAKIFVAVENARVNYLVKHYYRGVKNDYQRMQEGTLLALSQMPGMTLRRGILRTD